MLTPADIDALKARAGGLAQRRFGGAGSVGRNSDGIVSREIAKVIKAAANP
jgi:hypothetical protein